MIDSKKYREGKVKKNLVFKIMKQKLKFNAYKQLKAFKSYNVPFV